MARQARAGLAGVPHLLMQQVHEGQWLVRDDADRRRFVDILRTAARDHQVLVHAYSIGSHDWYALGTPASDTGLSLMVQAVGRQYVAYYNRRHTRHGSLWAGRFRDCVVATAQDLLDCMVWIETVHPEGDCASSPHHLGRVVDPLVSDHAQFWTLGNTPFDRDAAWKKRLDEGLAASRVRQLHEAVHKGWALGQSQDIQRLQAQTERRLTPGRRGRPPKTPADPVSA